MNVVTRRAQLITLACILIIEGCGTCFLHFINNSSLSFETAGFAHNWNLKVGRPRGSSYGVRIFLKAKFKTRKSLSWETWGSFCQMDSLRNNINMRQGWYEDTMTSEWDAWFVPDFFYLSYISRNEMYPAGPERRRKPQVSQQNRRCPHLTSLISAHLCSEKKKKKKIPDRSERRRNSPNRNSWCVNPTLTWKQCLFNYV